MGEEARPDRWQGLLGTGGTIPAGVPIASGAISMTATADGQVRIKRLVNGDIAGDMSFDLREAAFLLRSLPIAMAHAEDAAHA